MAEVRDPLEHLFPDCVTATIAEYALTNLDIVKNVEYRGLSPDDPTQTLAFDVVDWQAGEEEMAGTMGTVIPTETVHTVSIEFINKHSNEAEGQEIHRRALREIRTILYADATLGVALGQLSRTADGVIERMLRWKVLRQQSGSSQINGAFVSLSAIEFMFTTEMVPE